MTSTRRVPRPQAILHRSDESDVQEERWHGEPASEAPGDAENFPNTPDKSTPELPVLATKLGLTALKTEAATRVKLEMDETDMLELKS